METFIIQNQTATEYYECDTIFLSNGGKGDHLLFYQGQELIRIIAPGGWSQVTKLRPSEPLKELEFGH